MYFNFKGCGLQSNRKYAVKRVLVNVTWIFAFATTNPSFSQQESQKVDPAIIGHFESAVRPLLLDRCSSCHGADTREGSLRLDTADGLTTGGMSGPVVIPGEPDRSLLIQAVQRLGDLKMPPEEDDRLTGTEIQKLIQWVEQGAVWPSYQDVPPTTTHTLFSPEQKAFWSFQPVGNPPIPTVNTKHWPATPVDCFVLSRLEKADLQPAPLASKQTWLRRISLNLLGLPPSVREVDKFLTDTSPHAKSKVVDRLLASPHYGERWARYWLDIARYSDTLGQEADWILRYAWRYRDYIIRAYNEDKPYREFIIEQIAGDLLPPSEDPKRVLDQIIASGFLMFSPKATAEADKELMKLDIVDEQIDVMGRAFMSLTIACARCHDHKFDPIPTVDYYSLAGIFRSTKTMVDSESTSMWSEIAVPYVRSSTEQRKINQLTDKIQLTKQQMDARRTTVDVAQMEWERQLLAATQTAKTPASDRLHEILLTPVSHRTFDQQRDLEITVLVNPKSIVSTPETVPGLHAWYPIASLAQENQKVGSPVFVWRDKGPHGLDLKKESSDQTTPPIYISPGFQNGPALQFSQNTDELKTSENFGLHGDVSYTTFFVAEFHLEDPPIQNIQTAYLFGTDKGQGTIQFFEIDSQTTKYRLDIGSASGQDAETTSLAQNVPVIVSARKQSRKPIHTTKISVNGVPQQVTGSDLSINVLPGPLHLGYATLKVSAPMDVAEMVVFNRALDDVEEQAIGYYLSQKYGLKSNYEHVLSDGTVQVVTIAPEARNEKQRQLLREYYLTRHDKPYREASKQQTVLQAELRDLYAPNESIMVLAPQEQEKPSDLRVYRRGNYNTPGKRAPRRFLQIIEGTDQPPIETNASGRLELARWIANPDHPLTSRVMVNRIWKGHFGTGIVASSDNFGALGAKPTHPQLLDWLSRHFVENNGSVKKLHRVILLSNTYGQSHTTNSRAVKIDPENQWLWRMPRRRLEAEPLRDTMLALSGRLDETLHGTFNDWFGPYATVVDKKRGLVALAKPSRDILAYTTGRRSIYLPVSRNQLFEMFSLFDYSDPSAVMADRADSTVAPQSLFMMNNKIVREDAENFARRLLAMSNLDDEQRVRLASQMAFTRETAEDEVREAIEYLTWYTNTKEQQGMAPEPSQLAAWQSYCQLLFCQNEFIYVD